MNTVTIHTPHGDFTAPALRGRYSDKQITGVTLYKTTRSMHFNGKWQPPGEIMPRWHHISLDKLTVNAVLYCSGRLGTWDVLGREWERVVSPGITTHPNLKLLNPVDA